MSEHYSPNFYTDTPPRLSKREHARILGVRAVIAGLMEQAPEPFRLDGGAATGFIPETELPISV